MKNQLLLTRLIVLVTVLSCALGAGAYDFEYDGIYYDITSSTEKTVKVTYKEWHYNSYTGTVNIPLAAIYNGENYSVTAIGDHAFWGCDGLQHVTISSSVITIEEVAFQACYDLLSVSIGSKVESIGRYAFADCIAMKTVYMPNSVTSIGSNAFYNCDALENLTISKSLTTISDHAFSGCESLKNVTIPSSVITIENDAFSYCTSLENVNLPSSVTSIGNMAFYVEGNRFSSVTCEATTPPVIQISTFSPDAHYYLTLYVPAGCRSAYESAAWWSNLAYIEELSYDFASNGIFYNITSSSTVEVTHKSESAVNSYSGDVVIPPTVKYNGTTYTVTRIGEGAFNESQDLFSVSIPNTVTVIDKYAFCGCMSLTEVEIPNSVITIGASAFDCCNGLEKIIIPNSVVTIGKNAFNSCTEITKAIIGNSVTSIGENAFESCIGMSRVTIGPSVTNIGAQAFANCQSLTRVECRAVTPPLLSGSNVFDNETYNSATLTVPKLSETDYQNADYWKNFYSIEQLPYGFVVNGIYYNITGSNTVEVTVGATPTNAYIDGGDFYTGNVTIPPSVTFNGTTYSVTSIGPMAFGNCVGLTGVTIPNTVTSIRNSAFGFCTALTSVTIPASVNTIETDAFYSCSALKGVIIPDLVTSIPIETFSGCTALKSVIIGKGVTSIDLRAFRGCNLRTVVCMATTPPAVKESTFDSGIYSTAKLFVPKSCSSAYRAADYWKNFGSVQELACDFTVNGLCYNITGSNTVEVTYIDIQNNCYSGNLNIPSSVTFNGTNYQVTAVGYAAFFRCFDMTGVSIPNTVTSIGKGSFMNSGLTSVVIPNSVTSMSKKAFCGCTSLTNATLSNSLTSISDSTFYYCTDLKGISIPDNVTTIGDFAFSECTSLNSISIPNNVTTIGDYAFYYCINMNSLNLGNSVISIGEATFADCNSLPSVTIPNSVEVIGMGAFWYCDSVKSVTIGNSVNDIGGWAFCGLRKMTVLTISNSVITIGDGAFADCPRLPSVKIPDSVKSIGYQAFIDCYRLTSVVIGNSVTSIGDSAFVHCYALTDVTCLATTPPTMMARNVFDSDTYDNVMLFVPKASLTSYKSVEWWKTFATIKPHLDYALNTGTAAVEFTSSGNYPWINVVEDGRVYAQSGNKGFRSSSSTLTTTITVGSSGGSVSFDFKAWGEGSSWDVCKFLIDGTQKFSYGERDNDWETYTAQLSAGTHTLTWTYTKDGSVNPEGDYFAVDNVSFTGLVTVQPGDSNGDGFVNISDVTALINYLLTDDASNIDLVGADVNNDEFINISDVTALINYLLTN